MSKTILSVVGARPNFMKIAPILHVLERYPEVRSYLVHTGQHYDDRLSHQFFVDLDIPPADINLEVGSMDHGAQTGEMMKRLEPVMQREKPDLLLVVGDVNSTIAGALVASKLHIPIAHIESGLRSFDRRMPEEINRVVTDVLSDLLFVTEPAGVQNLEREGISHDRIFLVGDVMVDSVARTLPRALAASASLRSSVSTPAYAIITLHRPANVDAPERLEAIVAALEQTPKDLTLFFPVHPRTEARLRATGLQGRLEALPHLRLMPPLGYLEFLGLLARARFALTDSGGIQSEAAYLRVPCLTLRDTTERPETVELGANRLLGTDPTAIGPAVAEALQQPAQGPVPSSLMDGRAAERIVEVLLRRIGVPY